MSKKTNAARNKRIRPFVEAVKEDELDLTPEEADAAYDAAPKVPMTREEINKIVDSVVNRV